ncbi:phage Gp37/Gp68 family protein [Microcoleus sp. ARI1-B5]|uniref:phage Gp37/Gp68 family protein n=1 Tax=unclassified Microcoleus TaxID=2642155 RepID=UPI002FD709EC
MTNISWTNESWNPIVGCSRLSAGCANCYAETAASSARLQQFSQYQQVAQWDGTVNFVESQLYKPLHWRSPRKIFVCSMADLFHVNVADEWIDQIFAVMALCPQHTFQVLTKRPERMLQYIKQARQRIRVAAVDIGIDRNLKYELYEPYETFDFEWPLPNVWLGTSVENQKATDRIRYLVQIPAAVRFLSCEPLLELIDLRPYLAFCSGCQSCNFQGNHKIGSSKINWIIVGGESGTDARMCNIEWIRSIVSQSQSANVPVFVKQLGSNAIEHFYYPNSFKPNRIKSTDRKGGDISKFPEDLRIREFPSL